MHLIEGLLENKSDIQPSTIHADTQGQSAPVFALATLFGFDLMPRIRNFKDLIFYRPSERLIYPHIDELFGDQRLHPAGRPGLPDLTSSTIAATSRWAAPGTTLTSLLSAGRRRGEDSPEGYPQTPPYQWWNYHDAHDAAE